MSRVDRIGIQWDQWAPVRGKIGGISRVGRAETSTRASHPACICSSRRASDIDSRPRRPSRPLDAPTRVCARAAPALFSPALALVRMWTALLDPVIWAPVSTFCFFLIVIWQYKASLYLLLHTFIILNKSFKLSSTVLMKFVICKIESRWTSMNSFLGLQVYLNQLNMVY